MVYKKKKKVIAYFHTHWDREWYRECEIFTSRLVEVFDDVLKQLQNKRLQFFFFDAQVCCLLDYLEMKPENKKIVKNLIKEKRLFVGPFFVSTDSLVVCDVLYFKNLQLGMQISKQFHNEDFIGYVADSFGHSKSIVKLFKLFNIEQAVFWRGLTKDIPTFFNFDGILSLNLKRGYFQDILLQNKTYEDKAMFIESELEKIDEKKLDSLVLPLGADHLKLPENAGFQLEQVNRFLKKYFIVEGTIFEYFKENKINKKNLHNVSKSLNSNENTFLLKGVYSCQSKIKREYAIESLNLCFAEKLFAYSLLLGLKKNYKCHLDKAFKKMLQNLAHDSIYSCNIDSVNEEVLLRYKQIGQISNFVEQSLLLDFEKKFGDCENLTILNLSNSNYNMPFEYESTKKFNNLQCISKRKGFSNSKLFDSSTIPVTEDFCTIYKYLIPVCDLKKFSSKTFKISDFNYSGDIIFGENFIENKYWKFSFDDEKNFCATFKKSGKIFRKNFKLINTADIGDSYNFGPLKNDVALEFELEKIQIVEKNKARCTLQMVYILDIPSFSNSKKRSSKTLSHRVYVNVSLKSNQKFLQFDVDFENKSDNHKIQFCFDFEKSLQEVFVKETLDVEKYEVLDNYNIYESIVSTKGVEIEKNVFVFQNFMYSNNIGLVSCGINSFEVEKNYVKLNLLRSVDVISNPKNPSRTTPAGPPLKSRNLLMRGNQHFSFALCCFAEEKEMYDLNEEFSSKIYCFEGKIGLDKSEIFDFDNDNIFITHFSLEDEDKICFNIFNKTEEIQVFCLKKISVIYICDGLNNVIQEVRGNIELSPKSYNRAFFYVKDFIQSRQC